MITTCLPRFYVQFYNIFSLKARKGFIDLLFAELSRITIRYTVSYEKNKADRFETTFSNLELKY